MTFIGASGSRLELHLKHGLLVLVAVGRTRKEVLTEIHKEKLLDPL